jgi:hypothetical protein
MRKPLAAGVLAAAALALLPSVASAASAGPPLRACGNLEVANGLLIGDIITRRVTCRNARRRQRPVSRAQRYEKDH